MSLPVISSTFRVALEWINTGTPDTATNVMHFRNPGATPADVASHITAHVTSAMWGGIQHGAVISEVNVTPLDGTSTTFPYLTDRTAKWQGNGASGDYNPQVAAIVKFVTAKRGRSYRGKAYLPWIAEGSSSNGTMDGSVVTAVTAGWVAFLAAMHTAGSDLVVASYRLQTAEDVVGVIMEPRCATQRKRLTR